jgi:N-acetylmuramoyl-L-alanine amidase
MPIVAQPIPETAVAAAGPAADVRVGPNLSVTDERAAALDKAPRVAADQATATLIDVRRTVLPELVRVTLELDREVPYRDARLEGPPRVYFDLQGAAVKPDFDESLLTYPEDIVRQIRVGGRPNRTARVTLNLEGTDRYSVFTLYNPYRLVIDVYRKQGSRTPSQPSSPSPVITHPVEETASALPPTLRSKSAPTRQAAAKETASKRGGANSGASGDVIASTDARPIPTPTLPAPRPPETPSANASGSFSIARQLGLGVSRIVIDPGHGGHDPGALGKKITEAELVLDVASRLEKLLRKDPSFDVVMTRKTDVFIPLEERTAMANRAGADLFLSIHANASRNHAARGVETYFLNFASNPEAEAVAARENAASGRSMHQLGDIVKAIALNNKLDESRELASLVQTSLSRRLRADDEEVRDLGVKQAPFVVLIGAGMPSVLAEISFISNARDAQLLRTGAHRQKIAEALYDAVAKYQRALKSSETIASQ